MGYTVFVGEHLKMSKRTKYILQFVENFVTGAIIFTLGYLIGWHHGLNEVGWRLTDLIQSF